MATAVNVWTAEAVSAVSAFGKIIGESQLFGTKSTVQGQALALMAMSEGLSITEMRRRYHIVGGKELSMRADYMRAEFRRLGGVYRWLNTGDDGKVATLYVKYQDNELEVSYSIEDAKREGLVKPDSRWVKAPGDMLRARVSTKAIRMVCTEVLAGFTTDEEMEASVVDQAPRIEHQPAGTVQQASQPDLRTMADDGQQQPTTATATVQNTVEVMASTEQVALINTLFTAIGASESSRSNSMAKRGVSRWEDLTSEEAEELIAALQSKLPAQSDPASPITAEMEQQIQSEMLVVAQEPGGAAMNDMIKAHLDIYKTRLSQLTCGQAQVLLLALKHRQIAMFTQHALAESKSSEGNA